MQNSIVMFTSSVFDWKCPFRQIWSKKSNCQFELKSRTRRIWMYRVMQKICGVHLFWFRSKKAFLGKSGQKNQNCQFSRKFGTKTNLNMWNSIMIFTFSVFDRKYLFRKIWSKKSKLLKVKFDTKTNFNMQNSNVMSILSVLDWK